MILTATKHELPTLPYALDALAPQISEETMFFHYKKHQQAYIDNLNQLIPETPYENSTLEEIIMNADGAIFNNGSQAWNHTFYFLALSPDPKSMPSDSLREAIDRDFGSFDTFKEQMTKAAVSLFGSGWAWLAEDKTGRLQVIPMSNAGNPLREGMKPLLTIDVWEHAYYIDYRNRRAEAVKAIWDRIDWRIIEGRYEKL